MPSKAIYKCRCGAEFTARTADRARGWARFCSKKCKAVEQEGRTHQHRDRQHRIENDSYTEAGYDDDGSWDAHKDWV